ncbi:ABC-2 family transporter protein [Gimesia maris]|nr:ABC-2 family transporter protein [Gimesia maris]
MIWISGLIFMIVLTGELILTAHDHARLRTAAERATAAERENWLNQGDRDPHGAAHHGTFLFKPVLPVSLLDPGLLPYSGTTIRVEAHVRHRLTNRPAENDVELIRSSLSTPAKLVQGVIPLLLILYGCGAITRERQQGTFSIIRSFGIPWSLLISAKNVALLVVAFILVSPYFIIGTGLSLYFESLSGAQITLRVFLLGMGTAFYLFCWSCFVIMISARTRSSQMSLTVLLMFWGITTLCLPPLSTNLVSLTNALPSQEEVRKWSNQRKYGNEESTNIYRKIREELTKEMLTKYQVKSTRELPFNFSGLVMLETEKVTDRFYQEDTDRLRELQKPYERAVAAAAWLSPFMAIHQFTASLAGTDNYHHDHFDAAAEEYRQHLVQVVNKADTQKESPEALRGSSLWKAVREFEYQPPSVSAISHVLWSPILLLVIWLASSLVMAMKPNDSQG